MEHRIPILNERDRQSLLWLRKHVGDARLSSAVDALTQGERKPYVSALCRYLGVWPPVASEPQSHSDAGKSIGDQYLAQIRTHLARQAHSQAR
ncbi:hypothetical protein N0A02_32965 (plasmid) [Paraburkholderia acidicola]|uniref:Uncharacterized protein n=1 Tax=Paraburkholderia acidicola TaxID=1912599 RepID=A0ABV1M162_9BURK